MVDAYRACFEYCRDKDLEDKECRDILFRSGHRMFAEVGRLALFSRATISTTRRTLLAGGHMKLICFLESLELTENKLKDTIESGRTTTVTDMYVRNLLFASCKPNQLNQQDLLYVFNTLEMWAIHATLDAATETSLIVVDLESNQPPQVNRKFKASANLRALNAEILCYEAEAFVKEVSTVLPVPDFMQPRLITHLTRAWSEVQPRNFRRINSQGRVRLSLGLRAVHYFLAGAVDFSDQIANTDTVLRREVNPFLDVDYESVKGNADEDPWSQAHDLKTRIPENPNIEDPDSILHRTATQEVRKFEHHELRTLDTSPGGYRLLWEEQMPRNLQVGDLVSLREENDPRWCVAVLRWIGGEHDQREIGLQLLSPRAIPVAVRLIQKKGNTTGYSRGLLLPGLEAIGQQATIITPRLPFKEGQKVLIHRQGLQGTGLLEEVLLNTESFNQFSFRMLDGYLENQVQSRNMDPLSAMTREDSTRGP